MEKEKYVQFMTDFHVEQHMTPSSVMPPNVIILSATCTFLLQSAVNERIQPAVYIELVAFRFQDETLSHAGHRWCEQFAHSPSASGFFFMFSLLSSHCPRTYNDWYLQIGHCECLCLCVLRWTGTLRWMLPVCCAVLPLTASRLSATLC